MAQARLVAFVVAAVLVGASGCTTTSSGRDAPSIVLPSHPKAYFFGDSWTHGKAAGLGQGYPYVLGATLGWQVELGPDNSGAGYVRTRYAPHSIFPTVAASLPHVNADIIILQGGLNDESGSLNGFSDAVMQTVSELQRASGDTPIVLLGPTAPDGNQPADVVKIDADEASVAKRLGLNYISPLKEHWFTAANSDELEDHTTGHPNTIGHAYYAARLAADLGRFVKTASG